MTDALDVAPVWAHAEQDGFVRSSSAVVVLREPLSNPDGPSTTLFLEISEDEDLVDFSWFFGTSEEEANFGPSVYGDGRSPDLQEAEVDCWEETVAFLRVEGYSDEEIIASLGGGR